MIVELSSGQRIAYDRYGDDAAIPVVLLHGLSGSRIGYAAVVAHLLANSVERGEVQVLNVDLRGHGESAHATPATYDAASFAGDIAELIESTVGQPAGIVGHSLGGVVAAAIAARHRHLVRAVFLEDPPLFEGDDERRASSPVASFFPILVAAVRELQARGAVAAEYEPLVLSHTPAALAADRCVSLSTWDPDTMQAAIDGLVWHGFDPEASLACPVTILRADPAVGAVFAPSDDALVTAANPHASITMIEGAAHSIHVGTTLATYLDHLDRFIDSLS